MPPKSKSAGTPVTPVPPQRAAQLGQSEQLQQFTQLQPRWLSAAEQVVWRSFIEATQLLTDRLDQELQRDSGMPHTYYEVLVRLSEVPDRRLRMSALADRSLSSRSRLSHAVARLEQNGWVRRELCATDRRGQLAVLTDAGFAALEAAAPGHVEGVREHLLDQLTCEQVRQLGEICAAITAGLRDAECDALDDSDDAPAG